MAIKEGGHARRQAEKRAEILAAAKDVFLTNGYARTNMDQVLAKTGGSKRTLYNHFPSKDVLFVEVVRQLSDRVLTALEPELDASDLRGTLIRLGREYLAILLTEDGRSLFRAVFSESPHMPELRQIFLENGPGRVSRHLRRFFEAQHENGLLKVADPALAAEQFIGMIRGDLHIAALTSPDQPTSLRVEETVVQAVDIFLCGAAPDLCGGCQSG